MCGDIYVTGYSIDLGYFYKIMFVLMKSSRPDSNMLVMINL